MDDGYSFIKKLSTDLVGLKHPRYGQQLWVLIKLRSHKKSRCVICDAILGISAYRPLTNLGNRYCRICEDCMKELCL